MASLGCGGLCLPLPLHSRGPCVGLFAVLFALVPSLARAFSPRVFFGCSLRSMACPLARRWPRFGNWVGPFILVGFSAFCLCSGWILFLGSHVSGSCSPCLTDRPSLFSAAPLGSRFFASFWSLLVRVFLLCSPPVALSLRSCFFPLVPAPPSVFDSGYSVLRYLGSLLCIVCSLVRLPCVIPRLVFLASSSRLRCVGLPFVGARLRFGGLFP